MKENSGSVRHEKCFADFSRTRIEHAMTLHDIIDARAILPSLKVQNKKQLLQELSQALSSLVAIDSRVIFEKLLQREKLGSTGLGAGHCHTARSPAVDHPGLWRVCKVAKPDCI
jgi:hypothetical protein